MNELPPQLQALFPITKLQPPGARDTIRRDRLTAHLRELVLEHPLTLIAAPAGSGKTTLAADALVAVDGWTTRWLSLDEDDNELTMLLVALALTLLPDVDIGLIESIRQEQLASQQVANVLINHLSQTGESPYVLVLDDLHVLTADDIYDFFGYFLDRLPAHVHIVATTRSNPPLRLGRMRANAQLAEVRLDALLFSREEVDKLLNEVYALDLDDPLLDDMLARTEGWVAGLRLLGLTLANIEADKRATYVAALAHRNRYVFDLMAEEVLSQQSDELRLFMLQTSILDVLTPTLCRAVTCHPRSDELLRRLHQQNLFLVSLGDGTFRYHALFHEFLRQQAATLPSLTELHLRAAQAHTAPGKQIQHFVAAQAWDDAVKVINRSGKATIEQSNRRIVQQWLALLPEDVRASSGWLIYMQGALAYHRGEFEAAMHAFTRAETRFREEANGDGIFEAIMMHNAANADDDRLETQRDYIRRAEPYATDDRQRFLLELTLAWAYLNDGRPADAEAHFVTTFRLLQRLPESLDFAGFQIAPPIALAFSDLNVLRQPLERLLSLYDLSTRAAGATIHALLAHIARWQGDMSLAQAAHHNSAEIWQKLGGPTHLHDEMRIWHECQMAFITGDDVTVDRLTAPARDQMTGVMHLAMLRARWAWQRGDIAEARFILGHMPSLESMRDSQVGVAYRLSVQTLLEAHEPRLFRDLEPWLVDAIPKQQQGRYFYSLFCTDLRVCLAYAYLVNSERTLALDTFTSVLSDYEKRGQPGRLAGEGAVINDLLTLAIQQQTHEGFARSVLSLTSTTPQRVAIPGTHETLTPRESEVLRLIVDGASNRTISETLFISEPTVKTHVNRILGKLNVRSRSEAAARARQWNLPL